MANKIIDDYGNATIAVGYEGSKARVRVQYPKLINDILYKRKQIYMDNMGVSSKMNYSEFENICEDAGVNDKIIRGHIFNISGEMLNEWIDNNYKNIQPNN